MNMIAILAYRTLGAFTETDPKCQGVEESKNAGI